MKHTKNKVERQVAFLKNYLSIKVRVKSNHYFVVDNQKEVEDVYVTATQPRLINGRFGNCYLFEFDNGNLFAPCGAVCFTRNEVGEVLIKTKNEKGKEQAIGCDDFSLIKDINREIKIRINSEHAGWAKTQQAVENCYQQQEEDELQLLKKLERIN